MKSSLQHNKLCYFIADIMDYFLADNDQPKTNKPNGQAGDEPIFELGKNKHHPLRCQIERAGEDKPRILQLA